MCNSKSSYISRFVDLLPVNIIVLQAQVTFYLILISLVSHKDVTILMVFMYIYMLEYLIPSYMAYMYIMLVILIVTRHKTSNDHYVVRSGI